MRKVGVYALQPGQIVGRLIYNSRGDMLLRAGAVITAKNIKKLIDLGVTFIYVDDGFIPDIEVEDIITTEVRLAAVQQVKKILLEVKNSRQPVIRPQAIYGITHELVEQLLKKRHLMLNLVDLRTRDDYTFAHSVNVCVLALMTGITLNYTEEELMILGTGALLHDIGKAMIPDEILNKPAKLTREEFNIMEKHAFYGYQIIKSVKKLGNLPPLIALQHHEHYDGSGYPLGIKETNFHDFAQIVAIADKYDALTSERIYRQAFMPHEVYELCAGTGNYIVKASIAKAFLYNIAAYSPGTLVQLNNGNIAVVTDTPKGYSRFPKVRVLFDREHKLLAHRYEINLIDIPGLFVVRVLSDDDVIKLANSRDYR